MRTSRGENTSAAWGVANFLLRLRAKYHPDYVVWVNDAGDSFRTETYPEYKSTREKLDDEMQADFDRAVEHVADLLEAFRIPAATVQGYEADDVIGTLAAQAAGRGLQAVIVSGDKDFYQLIGPGVALLNPGAAARRESRSCGSTNRMRRTDWVCRHARSSTTWRWSVTAPTTCPASRASGRRARASCWSSMVTWTPSSPTPVKSPRSGHGKRCWRRPPRRGCPGTW